MQKCIKPITGCLRTKKKKRITHHAAPRAVGKKANDHDPTIHPMANQPVRAHADVWYVNVGT